ncbi:formylglycine-generating enzyme family protein [Microbacterium invictum]|uniref:SUMF1/EgtB/PvdO family nonheme iron enzyme n=1 Tax=Microbacterium invictum TaxID=515415 RepID=A0ABZ0VIZ9_9MICO|nr:SUMF1/EgtB/PvdO family nonheme iron enzyme [Microbacterium invictum]WQB71752.1 SUMF1/EgtB/PvdO family nonheme iron enzyme [Microbacterium invictum]
MTDIELARIPAGDLIERDARGRARGVIRMSAFDIGVFPVTEELVAELIGEVGRHPRRPATALSWFRAVRLCNAASEWEGLDPVYTFEGEEVLWDLDADGFRLPTEREWEFACRAGSPSPHYGPLPDVAWTALDGVGSPQDVGGKLPNLFGIFDTLGNVWEWCWDPFDPDASGDARVIRGGGFADDAWSARADIRRGAPARSTHGDVGIRFARSSS